jgi:hypothetical protein
MARLVVCAAVALMTLACASVTVLPIHNNTGSNGKDLGPKDSGVRFYRPAWYVWITAAPPSDKVNVGSTTEKKGPETSKVTDTQSNKTTAPGSEVTKSLTKEQTSGTNIEKTTTATFSTGGKSYTAQIVELPDFTQEYVVQWRPGLGSVTPEFTLSNGWNLVAFKAMVDSKASELVTSVGTLAAGGLLAARANFKGAGLYKLEVDSSGRLSLGNLVLPLE